MKRELTPEARAAMAHGKNKGRDTMSSDSPVCPMRDTCERLADKLERPGYDAQKERDTTAAAAELRRLSASEAALLEALENVVRHFTKTPSTLADTTTRGDAHKLIARTKGAGMADKHPAEVLANRRHIEGPLASWQREAEVMLRRIPALEAELDQLHAEVMEQARLLGMSGERELALWAKIDLLRKEVDELRDANNTFATASILPDDKLIVDGAEFDALRKDAERLDWLADPENTIGNVDLPRECVEQNLHSLRDAIDAAWKLT